MKLSFTLFLSSALLLLSIPSTSGASSLRHQHAARSTDADADASRPLTEIVKERLSFQDLENEKDILNLSKFAEWMDSYGGDDTHTRHLQATRPCGEEIGRTSVEEIKQVLEAYVSQVIALDKPPSEVSKAREALSSLVKYDFVAIKVCSTCSMITEEMLGTRAFNNTDEHGFQTYCGPESYGYDAVHSSLVFAPIDPTTGLIFIGYLRGFVNGRSLHTLEAYPSTAWPRSVSRDFERGRPMNSLLFSYIDYLSAMVAASAGAVSITPDYIGYGESVGYNRTFISKIPYEQAISLAWLGTKKYIDEELDSCSFLENTATLTGYAEGGYAAIVGALALEQNGVRILGTYPGGAPIDIVAQIGWMLETYAVNPPLMNSDQNFLLKLLVPFIAFGYSTDLPFLDNAFTGQNLVSATYSNETDPTRDLLFWFGAGPENPLSTFWLFQLVPSDPTTVLNPEIRALFEIARAQDIKDPCVDFATNTTDKLCAALKHNSLLGIGGLEDISFPVQFCHSIEDDGIAYANLPEFPFVNPNVTLYAQDDSLLRPQGPHLPAQIYCSLSPIEALGVNLGGDDSPTLITPLAEEPEMCATRTRSPTAAPVTPPPFEPIPEIEPVTPQAPPDWGNLDYGQHDMGPRSSAQVQNLLLTLFAMACCLAAVL